MAGDDTGRDAAHAVDATNLRDRLVNGEAEAALVGSMMVNNRIIDSVADLVEVEDFADPACAAVFAAIVREASVGRSATPVTLRPMLEHEPALAALGGGRFLAQLTGSGAIQIGWKDFAQQVASLAARRRLVDSLHAALIAAGDLEQPIEDVVDAADHALMSATIRRDGIEQASAAECIGEVLAGMGQPRRGVTSRQIAAADNLLGPLRPKQLTIGAGRPGMGKTAFALSYSLGVAEQGHGVLFISLEMSRIELGERMAADMCFSGRDGVPYDAIRDQRLIPQHLREVARAHERAGEIPFRVVDAGSLTIARLTMLVRRHRRRLAAAGQSLDLVVVDYLQLLSPDTRGRSNYEAVSEISRGLKQIAKEQNVSVFALAQLSREVEKRPDKRPLLSDLRDSGQIEQDADAVLFLYRHEYYMRQAQPGVNDAGRAAWEQSLADCEGVIEFICAKRRNGRTGNDQGEFHAEYQAVRG